MKSVRQDIGGLGNLLFKEAYIWAQMRDGNIPDVYVQSYKYFEKYSDEIKTRFSNGIGKIDKVALHIRRGDYLKATQFHRNLWDTDYYREAIQLFPLETQFLVFCKDNQSEIQDEDDRIWCLDNLTFLLSPSRYEMYEHTTETGDLNAMASCNGIIGVNSTFSFWAAFLSPHKGLKVFPDESDWFVDGRVRTGMPPEWTRIKL